MERVKLKQKKAKRITRKKKVIHYAFLKLDEVEFRVPFEVADYVVDLHQVMMSIRTRLIEEETFIIGPSFLAVPIMRRQ